MRNSRIFPENNARYSNLMCENTHRAALTLSLRVTFAIIICFFP